ncbi:MAG: hypothetical protein ABSE04_00310 [Candidatus Microgenomates bacterium]|jgi:hypothetical protein
MATSITDGFDPGDDEKVISILDKWNGGPLSDRLYAKISKIAPMASTIIVIFRKKAANTEVLLLPRPGSDPTWPGMLNLPGKMFRAADFHRKDQKPENGPFERIQSDEIKTKFINPPKFAGVAFQDTLRGPVMALVYTVELANDTKDQRDWVWCEVTKLKALSNLIDTELIAIDIALRSYLAGSNHLPSL